MDKVEYRELIRSIKNKYMQQDYEGVIATADLLDMEKIKENSILEIIAKSYEVLGRPDLAREALLIAYKRTPTGKRIAYNLAMLCIKLDDLDSAVMFYEDFCKMAPKDNQRLLLKYEIGKAGGVPINNLATVLETYNSREMDDKWEYELARLYHEMGDDEKCAAACDQIILWYANGEYEKKALELKNMHKALNPSQQARYEEIMNSVLNNTGTREASYDAQETGQEADIQPQETENGKDNVTLNETVIEEQDAAEETAAVTEEAAAEEKETAEEAVSETEETAEVAAADEETAEESTEEVTETEVVEETETAETEEAEEASGKTAEEAEASEEHEIDFNTKHLDPQNINEEKTQEESIKGQLTVQEMFERFKNQTIADREEMNKIGEDRAAQILAEVSSTHDSSILDQFADDEEEHESIDEVIEPDVPLLNREDVTEPVDDGGEDIGEVPAEFEFERAEQVQEPVAEQGKEMSVDATQYIPVEQIVNQIAASGFEDEDDEDRIPPSVSVETDVYSEIDPGSSAGKVEVGSSADEIYEEVEEYIDEEEPEDEIPDTEFEPGRELTDAEKAIIAYETSRMLNNDSSEEDDTDRFDLNELFEDAGTEKDVEETIEESAEEAVETAEEAIEETAEEAAQDVEETIEEAEEEAVETIEETVEAVEEEAEETAETAEKAVEEAAETAEETIEEAAEGIVNETIENTAEAVQEILKDVPADDEFKLDELIFGSDITGSGDNKIAEEIEQLINRYSDNNIEKAEELEEPEEFEELEELEDIGDAIDTSGETDTIKEPEDFHDFGELEDLEDIYGSETEETKEESKGLPKLDLGAVKNTVTESFLSSSSTKTMEDAVLNMDNAISHSTPAPETDMSSAAERIRKNSFFGSIFKKFRSSKAHKEEEETIEEDSILDELMEDFGQEATEAVEEAAEDFTEETAEIEDFVEEAVEEAEEEIADAAESEETVEETVEELEEEAAETFEEIAEEAEEFFEKETGEIVEEAVDAEETIEETAGETVEDAVEEIIDAAAEVEDTVEEKADEVIEEAAEETAAAESEPVELLKDEQTGDHLGVQLDRDYLKEDIEELDDLSIGRQTVKSVEELFLKEENFDEDEEVPKKKKGFGGFFRKKASKKKVEEPVQEEQIIEETDDDLFNVTIKDSASKSDFELTEEGLDDLLRVSIRAEVSETPKKEVKISDDELMGMIKKSDDAPKAEHKATLDIQSTMDLKNILKSAGKAEMSTSDMDLTQASLDEILKKPSAKTEPAKLSDTSLIKENLKELINKSGRKDASPAPDFNLDDILNSSINKGSRSGNTGSKGLDLDDLLNSTIKDSGAGKSSDGINIEDFINSGERAEKSMPASAWSSSKQLSIDDLFENDRKNTAAKELGSLVSQTQKLVLNKEYKLSKEQRKDLAEFLLIDGMEEEICKTIEKLVIKKKSGDETGGHLIVTGDAKTGKTFLVIEMLKAVNKEVGHGNPRVAKVQAQALNGKNIRKVLSKVTDSDLVIENIGRLEDDTVRDLIVAVRESNASTMVILEGNALAADTMIQNFPEIAQIFKTRIDIGELTLTQWADVAQRYAKGQGYSIDDVALLALHAKIDSINTPDIRLGFKQVRQIVDDAIEKCEKRSSGRLFSAFSSKSDDDIIPLTEEDFM